jgi:hypothetical protein
MDKRLSVMTINKVTSDNRKKKKPNIQVESSEPCKEVSNTISNYHKEVHKKKKINTGKLAVGNHRKKS